MSKRSASRLSQSQVAIKGMTCGACETRVGRQLRRLDGVERVTVSARRGSATLYLSAPVSPERIRQAVEKAGYKVAQDGPPWLNRDPAVWRDIALGVALVALLALVLTATGLIDQVGALSSGFVDGNLAMVFVLGVAASLSTCMALTGGLVISLSARYGAAHPEATIRQRVMPQLWFNLGRLVGFSLLGAGLGWVGQLFRLTAGLTSWLMLAAAVVMGLLGLSLSGASPRLGLNTLRLPGRLGQALTERGEAGQDRPYSDWRAAGWGAASFFLPCGFTQAVQVYAAATGQPLQAGLVMGLFALGTAPGLLSAGALAALARGRTAQRVYRLLGVVVLAFAVLNGSNAVAALLPTGFDASSPADAGLSANVTVQDGYQVVSTEQNFNGYSPQRTTIYAGTPVRWQIESTSLGCASALDLRPFGLNRLVLQPGQTSTVEFTIDQPGDIAYTCSMGMYRAWFHVVAPPQGWTPTASPSAPTEPTEGPR
ncbi:MAG: sulfite exporter TauE/SafE family protein [Propionibacteriaceae bacterium]|nr:sulfite exporter TauE/SafE family protein [Propionibacteriaceae bacterium]